ISREHAARSNAAEPYLPIGDQARIHQASERLGVHAQEPRALAHIDEKPTTERLLDRPRVESLARNHDAILAASSSLLSCACRTRLSLAAPTPRSFIASISL